MSLNKVAKAAILALAMFSNAGIAEARAAKPQPAAAEPPKRVADDPGCRSCTQQAASMFARGEATQAQKLLSEWSSRCPNSAQLHMMLATILLSTGQNEAAEKESALATKLAPSSLAAHLQHAMALSSLDRKMQAKEAFERAVEIDPSC
jgi:Tfp pilus assembly protein PilF